MELLEGNGIKARIELRYRMPYSIWRKMHSKGCDFNHVDGKHYIRIIYDATDPHEEKSRAYVYIPYSPTTSKSVRAVWPTISMLPRRTAIRVFM